VHGRAIELDLFQLVDRWVHVTQRASSLTTKAVREASAKAFKEIVSTDKDQVFAWCGQLLEKRKWEYGLIAYDWAYRMRKAYSVETFNLFERWLVTYVKDWGDCDDFCTHAFGELLSQFNTLFDRVEKWTKFETFPVRRAAAVTLILPIRTNRDADIDPFRIPDLLMDDSHDLVLKGYGWMLKVLSQKDPHKVIDYVRKHEDKMPRVAFRYAIEKLDPHIRAELMRKG